MEYARVFAVFLSFINLFGVVPFFSFKEGARVLPVTSMLHADLAALEGCTDVKELSQDSVNRLTYV